MTDFKEESIPYVRIVDLGSDCYIICIIIIGYYATMRATRGLRMKGIISVLLK